MGQPVLTAKEAAYLVQRLDCPIPLSGHQDRNNFQMVITKLIQIAQWQENDDVTNDGAGESGQDTGD